MGFLSAGFQKLFAIRMCSQLQHKQMTLQSRLARVQKRESRVEKQLNSMKRSMTSQIQLGFNKFKSETATDLGINVNGLVTSQTQLTPEEIKAYTDYNNSIFQYQTSVEAQKSMIEDCYEELYEAQYEPLKDEEEEIETELASTKSQMETWEGIRKSSEQQEQQSLQNMFGNGGGRAIG